MQWTGVKVAILPHLALGDTTLYLRLAWHFAKAGAQVTLFSSPFFSMREHVVGVTIALSNDLDLQALAGSFDLVVCDTGWLNKRLSVGQNMPFEVNVAYTCAKKLPKGLGLDTREVIVAGQSLGCANTPFRLGRGDGHMVYWMDRYAEQVFGLVASNTPPQLVGLPVPDSLSARRVAIFPTTPKEAKNYSLSGFKRVARALERRGWQVEFVCTPGEQVMLGNRISEWPVHAFATIAELARYLSASAVVISNDSGGGHLGSMLGLATFTITRRDQTFSWRPGFNAFNQVISPLFTFKFMGKPVWRPFIPIWRIARALGAPPGKFGA